MRTSGRWEVEVGAAGDVGGLPASEDTPFDLASVSKSFVACCFARLWERGALTPEAQLGSLVPECRGSASEDSTLGLLLSHRAGLEAHLPLYAPLERGRPVERRRALLTAANARRARLDAAPFSPLYSDLGYLLAGEALTRVAAAPLDELIASEVSAPLELDAASARLWRARDAAFSRKVAPSEHIAFRGGELRGVVHDENAWAFAGHGAAGQAGLFGSVRAVLGLGCALLDSLAGRAENWLRRDTLSFLVSPRPGGSLRLGFDGKSEEASSAGPSASALTFGHLGFTGTSFWCDPVADAVTVLLTNRVCPSRANVRIRACRPVVHEALFAHASAASTGKRAAPT